MVNENKVLTSDVKTAQEKIITSSNQFNIIKVENDNLKRSIGDNNNKLK